MSDAGYIFTKLLASHSDLSDSHFGKVFKTSLMNRYKDIADNAIRRQKLISDACDVHYSEREEFKPAHDLMDMGLDSKCTENELKVLKLMLEGYTFKEIAERINKSIQTAYNIRDKIVGKIKQQLKEELNG